MKINKKIDYKMLVAMLQEELGCVHEDLNTTLADLETEERIQNRLQAETIRLGEYNRQLILDEIELKKQIIALNADFFDLGDLLMEAIEENKKSQPEQKLEDVVTGLDEFLQKQYQSRIEYLEELIFELGDDLDEQKEASKKTLTEMKKEAYDTGMAMEKLKKENSSMALQIENLKEDLETARKRIKEEAFEEDRKQITEEIEGSEEQTPKKQSSTTGETKPKPMAKPAGKNLMLDIKNKLCNKGYDVQDTGKSLLAKKPGNRHIEVKPAELPGSFKYIICGQTCYEFDQAIKASTYGAKAIAPKLDAEAIS